MSFVSPVWLVALAVIPCMLAARLAARRRARRYAIRFTAVPTLRLAAQGRPSIWRRLPGALVLAALTAVVLALARPQLSDRVAVGEASMMLVTDHSGSMAAAERSADTFIHELPSTVRVGAIAFSSTPDAVQAPVSNHAAAQEVIDGQTAGGATATGDALQLALQLLDGGDAKHPPSAIVLLSDGAANAGVDVITVARQARQDRIPIETVALGTPGGVLANPDPLGAPLAVPPDPQLMAQIAQASGGRAFDAQTADQLSSIYERLGKRLGTVARRHDVTAAFAIVGVVLLALAAAGATRWSGRLP